MMGNDSLRSNGQEITIICIINGIVILPALFDRIRVVRAKRLATVADGLTEVQS